MDVASIEMSKQSVMGIDVVDGNCQMIHGIEREGYND